MALNEQDRKRLDELSALNIKFDLKNNSFRRKCKDYFIDIDLLDIQCYSDEKWDKTIKSVKELINKYSTEK